MATPRWWGHGMVLGPYVVQHKPEIRHVNTYPNPVTVPVRYTKCRWKVRFRQKDNPLTADTLRWSTSSTAPHVAEAHQHQAAAHRLFLLPVIPTD